MDKFEWMDEKHRELHLETVVLKRAIDTLTNARMRLEEAKEICNKAVREKAHTSHRKAVAANLDARHCEFIQAMTKYGEAAREYLELIKTPYEDR